MIECDWKYPIYSFQSNAQSLPHKSFSNHSEFSSYQKLFERKTTPLKMMPSIHPFNPTRSKIYVSQFIELL